MIKIYTDGGCTGNPGPGGWAAVLLIEDQEILLSGGEVETTNNRMELTAVIRSLNKAEEMGLKGQTIRVLTDSQYVKNGLTQWITNWIRNGWKTAAKKPVKNRDLWILLKEVSDRHVLEWEWVRGHSGDHYNELCDSLVEQERLKFS